MIRTIAGLLSLIAVVALTNAAAADAANGEKLARRWCADCHVVSADQKRGSSTQAPPFSVTAKRRGFDAGKLALYLLLPHPKMPDMSLSRKEAADLAVYISRQGK